MAQKPDEKQALLFTQQPNPFGLSCVTNKDRVVSVDLIDLVRGLYAMQLRNFSRIERRAAPHVAARRRLARCPPTSQPRLHAVRTHGGRLTPRETLSSNSTQHATLPRHPDRTAGLRHTRKRDRSIHLREHLRLANDWRVAPVCQQHLLSGQRRWSSGLQLRLCVSHNPPAA